MKKETRGKNIKIISLRFQKGPKSEVAFGIHAA